MWTCCQNSSASLLFHPRLCIAIAPICNLIQGQNLKLSDEGDAIEKYIIGTSAMDGISDIDLIARYNLASPHSVLPFLCETSLVTGILDVDVPSQTVLEFYSSLEDKSRVRLMSFEGADHFDVITPSSTAWACVLEYMDSAVKRPTSIVL